MTPQEAITLGRAKLDELGTSSSYFDDTNDLYPFLTNAEREAANRLVMNFAALRKIGQSDRHSPSLNALIKQDPLNTTTVGAGYQEYALPSDYLETYGADYDYTGVTGYTGKVATLLSFEKARTREGIVLTKATGSKPVYYIRLTKIGFFPQPIGAAAAMYDHYYLQSPRTLTAAITSFNLGAETHYAIVDYMVAQALIKDGSKIEAAMALIKKFYAEIDSK